MPKLEFNIKVSDLDIWTELINYLKEVIMHDERMPGDLANEMQDKIGSIIKEVDKR